MSNQNNLVAEDIHAYLKQHEEKDLLRFITCGSVDDGKSTLIGRLLHDTKMIYEDQLAAISKDSKTHGTTGKEVDLALLVDGLQSEREQGITIDVAYRYFSTDKRKFIIADTPGHEQYTRNMATGASTVNVAILLIDARYGVQTQTRRHSFICSLLGIKHFIIAINKMDLVDYSQEKFEEIKKAYLEFSSNLDVPDIRFVPISALLGENVAENSKLLSWFKEDNLLQMLESMPLDDDDNLADLRFPVQYVNRPNLNFRGFCGTLASGVAKVGMAVKALPSEKVSTIKNIILADKELPEAYPGDAVTITLNDEIDISRGDMLVADTDTIRPSNAMIIDLVWMHEAELQLEKNYYVKVGSAEVTGYISEISYQVDVNTLEHTETQTVPLNGIARCKLILTESVTVDTYKNHRHTGNLIFIDRLTNVTVGAGMVVEPLGQENIVWHSMDVSKLTRAERFKQKPAIIWFTGLSGSGKSTTANAIEKQLFAMGYSTYLLDGDNVRHGLCSDLGFSDRDRVENIRRVGEVAKLMVDAGQIVLVSFISPFRRERQMVRQMVAPGEFFEVFVNTPIDICEQRDPKGLYKKARAGEIRNFTGIDSPYERPEQPEIEIDTDQQNLSAITGNVLKQLKAYGIIS
ncbi:sulfate adenylyltransferase subunit CysN [Teredinibacter waterburyi]|jgi:adenylylsulfate kinase (EC 2.7.1.25)/sulfate adenylyltransferase subunit 1 (EC 2.7.7.4)|uniref:sulfate adenylyltransferase subunit CysN n=1 Tax=Teredinibacter waterburyi TaxID=1500538 RepID=UPI00165F43B3|nr:sulfate adenylyltransferase subunit CysN [Teredinibacter waterburyi]